MFYVKKKIQRLGAAQQVLVSGSSAGGLGTFSNVDWIAERLPAAVVKKKK